MWGPRTIINGISSFMVEESHGIGSVRESNERRLAHAKNSGMWNKKNFKEFHEFFPEALGEILDKEDSGKSNAGSSKPKPTSSQNTDLKKNKDARINTKAPGTFQKFTYKQNENQDSDKNINFTSNNFIKNAYFQLLLVFTKPV